MNYRIARSKNLAAVGTGLAPVHDLASGWKVRIMAEGYIKVAKLGDLQEGALFPIIVDDEPVCLALVEGKVYAFTDNCTHISGPLNEGEFEHCVVTCPWHRARFDVRDGKVLRGPARQDLYTYVVKIEDDDISIYLPPE